MVLDLSETTIDRLQELMASGELTSRAITEWCLDRIAAVDPMLGSIIETNPEALDIADRLDAERAEGRLRGPLHGVPVALKDNIDTHDRMTTTAGSLALEGSIPPQDSFVAARLREAGAVLVAKANMSEWAYFRGKRGTSGWSARGGQCHNPYSLDHNPCGSSSGSAVAVSANLVPVAIGTETNGSIMCPSSVNGIVGLKPTVGLWSRAGIIPISVSQDTAGPMGRSVADVAAVLGAGIGLDERDRATFTSVAHTVDDYRVHLDHDGLVGARIGVARSFDGFDPRVLDAFEEALTVLTDAGAMLVDPVDVAGSRWADEAPRALLEFEFKAGLDAYLSDLGDDSPIRSLAELIDFNERHADVELAHFGHELLVASQARGGLDDPAYLDAKRIVQGRHRANLDSVLLGIGRGGPLDAIVAPSRDPAWRTDYENGDPRAGGSSAGPAAIAGYPNLTVPMGFVEGLPVGLSFFSRPWSEGRLLQLGFAYEQASGHRRPPELPT